MQKIINDTKLDFDDVLIRPKRSKLGSRSDVSLIRSFKFLHSTRSLSCIPICAANMDTTGSFDMANKLNESQCITCLHKHYSVEEFIKYFISLSNRDYIFYSTGINKVDLDKLNQVCFGLQNLGFKPPNFCIDVANGYSEKFVKAVHHIRNQYPESIIMSGNVVTPEMVEELLLHGGADIVKVGIGSGSVCTTRLKTGVGYPQLSAIMECADAAHGLGGHVCSDGGCKIVGDICKAFGANSDFVMLGSMLAGTDCCEGEWEYEYRCAIIDNNRKVVQEWWQANDPGYHPPEKRKKSLKFYGMSSKEAMNKHNGGVADYRTSEGRCVTIPYKGSTEDIIKDILGGLRSACTYIGAESIKDFGKKTTFILVNNTHNRIYEK
jgi:GMP reductase